MTDDRTRSKPNIVSVLFNKDLGEDGNLLDEKQRSMDGAGANFFYVYGLGNYWEVRSR